MMRCIEFGCPSWIADQIGIDSDLIQSIIITYQRGEYPTCEVVLIPELTTEFMRRKYENAKWIMIDNDA